LEEDKWQPIFSIADLLFWEFIETILQKRRIVKNYRAKDIIADNSGIVKMKKV